MIDSNKIKLGDVLYLVNSDLNGYTAFRVVEKSTKYIESCYNVPCVEHEITGFTLKDDEGNLVDADDENLFKSESDAIEKVRGNINPEIKLINVFLVRELEFKNHERNLWAFEQSLRPVEIELISRGCHGFIANQIVKTLSYACCVCAVSLDSKSENLKTLLIDILQKGFISKKEMTEFICILPAYIDNPLSKSENEKINLFEFFMMIREKRQELENHFIELC